MRSKCLVFWQRCSAVNQCGGLPLANLYFTPCPTLNTIRLMSLWPDRHSVELASSIEGTLEDQQMGERRLLQESYDENKCLPLLPRRFTAESSQQLHLIYSDFVSSRPRIGTAAASTHDFQLYASLYTGLLEVASDPTEACRCKERSCLITEKHTHTHTLAFSVCVHVRYWQLHHQSASMPHPQLFDSQAAV